MHLGLQAIGALMALQAIQIPAPPRGFGTAEADVVRDVANVIPPEREARINRIAFDVHAKSGGEIAVVTLPDIGDRAASDVALRIGREWGIGRAAEIGDRARNAGAVVLVVPKETSSIRRGECRIETGRGTEGFITDGEAGAICRAAIPLFQRGDYGAAVELVTLEVARHFAREFGFALDTALAPAASPLRRVDREPFQGRRSSGIPPGLWLILIIFLIFFVSSAGGARRRRRRGCGGCVPLILPFPMGGGFGGYHRGGWGGGGWGGGGGFGGGFGGFGGGGGFSGGGGGSSW